MSFPIIPATCMALALLGSMTASEPSPACKPMERYGVKGCELLPDRTCPPGYHKQAVSPPNPKMKAPTILMCVPDQPPAKEPAKKEPPGSNQ